MKFGKKRKIGLGGSGGLKDGCLVKELDSEKYDGVERILRRSEDNLDK